MFTQILQEVQEQANTSPFTLRSFTEHLESVHGMTAVESSETLLELLNEKKLVYGDDYELTVSPG